MKLSWTKNQKYFVFLLPLLLTFVFGIFGSDYTDQGFVRGFSWRLRLGETPYLDFVYPRPPLTIYLDAFFKILSPAFLEVFTERLRFYYQMLLIVFLVFSKVRFRNQKNAYLLFLTSYFISLGCFPPMSWYTTDGILFAALAFYFIDSKDWKFGLSLFFAFCSALTKQSFYPVPIFLFAFYLYNIKQFKIVPLVIGLIPLVLFGIFLFSTDTFQIFLSQSSGVTKLDDILKAGFLLYLKSTTFRYLFFLAISYYLFKRNSQWAFVFLVVVIGFDYFKFIWTVMSVDRSIPFIDWPRTLFVMSFLYLAYQGKKPEIFPYWFLLCVAWCTSLSWGFQTPVLFISGILVIAYKGLEEVLPRILDFKILDTLLVGSVLLFGLQNLYRHRQGRIWQNTEHLGNLDKKYTLIFTNPTMYELFSEMKVIAAKGPVSFLPAFSDSDYFLNQKPQLPLNWVSDIELRAESFNLVTKIQKCETPTYLYNRDFHPKEYSLIYLSLKNLTKLYSQNFLRICE